MPAHALALEGVDRRTTAERCGMNRQPLRDRGEGRLEFRPLARILPCAGGAPAATPFKRHPVLRGVAQRGGPRGRGPSGMG